MDEKHVSKSLCLVIQHDTDFLGNRSWKQVGAVMEKVEALVLARG